jgi:2-C-methyl-D-erythritol 4-phosphate cytidylyltransferase
MERYVIIVAGGSGKRMQSSVPKQFMLLNNRPVVMHVFDVFAKFDPKIKFVLVLNRNFVGQWKALCATYRFSIDHQLVEGGEERFYSVKKGLETIPKQASVAIHDAVRPLVSVQTLERCFFTAEAEGNAIPSVPVSDSYRIRQANTYKTIDRSLLAIVQTPQVFVSDLIKNAYDQDFNPSFTDDAVVLESLGHSINMVEGNPENIKITLPSDLLFATALLTAL